MKGGSSFVQAIAVVAATLPLAVAAQSPSPPAFELGVYGGGNLNVSWFHDASGDGSDLGPEPVFGAHSTFWTSPQPGAPPQGTPTSAETTPSEAQALNNYFTDMSLVLRPNLGAAPAPTAEDDSILNEIDEVVNMGASGAGPDTAASAATLAPAPAPAPVEVRVGTPAQIPDGTLIPVGHIRVSKPGGYSVLLESDHSTRAALRRNSPAPLELQEGHLLVVHQNGPIDASEFLISVPGAGVLSVSGGAAEINSADGAVKITSLGGQINWYDPRTGALTGSEVPKGDGTYVSSTSTAPPIEIPSGATTEILTGPDDQPLVNVTYAQSLTSDALSGFGKAMIGVELIGAQVSLSTGGVTPTPRRHPIYPISSPLVRDRDGRAATPDDHRVWIQRNLLSHPEFGNFRANEHGPLTTTDLSTGNTWFLTEDGVRVYISNAGLSLSPERPQPDGNSKPIAPMNGSIGNDAPSLPSSAEPRTPTQPDAGPAFLPPLVFSFPEEGIGPLTGEVADQIRNGLLERGNPAQTTFSTPTSTITVAGAGPINLPALSTTSGSNTVANNQVSGNTPNSNTNGGGIVSSGAGTTLDNSTVSGNTANGNAGGGGIINTGSSTTVSNNTVGGNSPIDGNSAGVTSPTVTTPSTTTTTVSSQLQSANDVQFAAVSSGTIGSTSEPWGVSVLSGQRVQFVRLDPATGLVAENIIGNINEPARVNPSVVRLTGETGTQRGNPVVSHGVNSGRHIAFGETVPAGTFPTSGTFTYNFVAKTAPTFGRVNGTTLPGTLTGSAAVDFTSLRVGVAMTVTMPTPPNVLPGSLGTDPVYTIQTPGGTANPSQSPVGIVTLPNGQRFHSGNGAFTTSPQTCTPACRTLITGHFYGAGAAFASILFQAQLPTASASLNGAAIGQKQ